MRPACVQRRRNRDQRAQPIASCITAHRDRARDHEGMSVHMRNAGFLAMVCVERLGLPMLRPLRAGTAGMPDVWSLVPSAGRLIWRSPGMLLAGTTRGTHTLRPSRERHC